ncbi:MAG: N-acetylglucosamine-6-phosphate deacetylase [Akkermansiaceae bacterium]|nr:N-acetylglucosamine-6-phosphate deacetylase [Verrucomicrobiales bacterium]
MNTSEHTGLPARQDAGGTLGGELHAFHYATHQPVRVRWANGRIVEVASVADKPPRELWLAPPLVDLQINGYAGVDFQQDELTRDDLLLSVRTLRRDGCAYFLLTLITDEWARLIARLKHLRRLRESSPELCEAIIGWHIEGPFLSDKPGYCGAHNPAPMRDPKPEDIHELRAASGTDRVLITLAPERTGAVEAIQLAASLGLRVSLGHTDADAETLQRAVSAGATGFTHLANGCARELDRHDNILWRVCDTPGLTTSFIPDGIHVPPRAFRLLHKLLDGPLYYTTDAMAAAGAGPGKYRLGGLELEVGADQIVRQPGKTHFAGSALRPIDAVFRAAKMLNCPWQECWRRFSEVPAQFMDFQNELRVGSTSFCLIDPAAAAVTTLLT